MGREERREQLLAAAAQVFSTQGYHQTKVSDIVAAAGVSQGTFYLYFDSKTEAFRALIRRLADLMLAEAFDVDPTTIHTPDDFAHTLRRVVRAVLGIILEARPLFVLYYREALAADPTVNTDVEAFFQAMAERLAENLRCHMDSGLVRRLNPNIVAHALLGMYDRAMYHVLGRNDAPVDLDALADELVSLELYGILERRTTNDERRTTNDDG